MSLPAGHNPNISMLEGGEGVPIMASQAGGNPEDTSALQNDFTEAEKDEIKQAAALVIAELSKDVNMTETERLDYSIKAANIHATKILKRKTENGEDDIEADATESEIAAANKAVELTATPEWIASHPDPKEREALLAEVRIRAILTERKRSNIKIVKAKTEKEAILEGSMTTRFAEDIKAMKSKPIYTEFYHVTDAKSKRMDKFRSIIEEKRTQLSDPASLQKMKLIMYNDVEKYKKQRLAQWDLVYQTSANKVSPILPIIKEGIRNEEVNITEFSRYIYCLSCVHQTVIVIPPIKGDVELFTKILYRLEKIQALTHRMLGGKHTYKIRRGLTIVFMPSFYGPAANVSEHLLLFSIFIDINRTNPEQIFILSESTVENYAIGAILTKTFSRNNILRAHPLTMLEPTYIVYPYHRQGLKNGFIISASTYTEGVNVPQSLGRNSFDLDDLKTDKSFGLAVGLAIKPVISTPLVESAKDTFTIRSSMNLHHDDLLDLKYAEGHAPGPCDGLLMSKQLNEYKTPFNLNTHNIKEKGDKQNVLMVVKLNPKGNDVPLCTLALTSNSLPLTKDDRHEASDPSVADPSVEKVHISIKNKVYSLRVPSDSNQVTENWKQQRFTKDEADFLNETRLRPGVLSAVFGEAWIKDLALFLNTLVKSECMTDTALLTKSQCYNCRNFLERVQVFFINNSNYFDLVKQREEQKEKDDFNEQLEELYGEEKAVPYGIDANHAREANDQERVSHKQTFGSISSYDHQGNANYPQNERRALVIGVNKKTGVYKFYIVAIQSDLKPESLASDEAKLETKVKVELPRMYKDYVFIY